MKTGSYLGAVVIGSLLLSAGQQAAAQGGDSAGRMGANDLGGVVGSANGPEAGVWVIAETGDLPTKFTKIVVTDERGRYLIPELPKANYTVWVRGYGLVDSPKVRAAPGKVLDLTALPASCRSTSRRGRKEWSAISSLACGTGARPPAICMT